MSVGNLCAIYKWLSGLQIGLCVCVCVCVQDLRASKNIFCCCFVRHINDYIFGKIYLSHSHSLTHPFKTRISTREKRKKCFSVIFCATPERLMMLKAEKRCCSFGEPHSVEIVDWEKEVVCAQIEIFG